MKSTLTLTHGMRLALFPLAAGLAFPAPAQEIGSLFTTPEERVYLDYLRDENLRLNQQNNFNIRDAVIPDIPLTEEVEEEPAGPLITEYKFGGIMERRNGSRMVWLNGNQVAEDALPDNMSLVNAASGTLLNIRMDGINHQLKPGQTFNVVAGRIQEGFRATTPAPAGPVDAQDDTGDAGAAEPVTIDTAPALPAGDAPVEAVPELPEDLEQLGAAPSTGGQ